MTQATNQKVVVPSERAEKGGDNARISLKEPRPRKGKQNALGEEEVRAEVSPGLGALLKQLLLSRRSKIERERSPSPVRKVLENSVDETSFLDQTVSRSASFLDRLISAMESKSDDLDFDHEFDLENEDQEIEENENLEDLLFFPDYHTQDSDSRVKNIFGNFLEEEEDEVEEETRNIAEEIRDLLQELEENNDFEQKMMNKAEEIIKSKLRNLPVKRLIRVRIAIKIFFFLSINSGQRLHRQRFLQICNEGDPTESRFSAD